MNQNNSNDSIVLLAKKNGPTSFSSLHIIKKALGTTKVGHTGTLDSFAQGLLVVCTGRLTKLAGNITEFDKTYEAILKFGSETDTLEYTGKIVKKTALPSIEQFQNAIKSFLGESLQAPPAFSAIHINGKRASDLARSGNVVEIPKRKITVYAAEISETVCNSNNQVEYAKITFKVSKGTYIRCLARDIAYKCGSSAHLIGLYRTQVGNFSIKNAAGYSELADFSIENARKNLKKYEEDKSKTDINESLNKKAKISDDEKLKQEILEKKKDFDPQTANLCGFEVINIINKNDEFAFKNGKPLRSAMFNKNLKEIKNDSLCAVFSSENIFLGLIFKNNEGRISYKFVLS